jgi:hypothetical protein
MNNLSRTDRRLRTSVGSYIHVFLSTPVDGNEGAALAAPRSIRERPRIVFPQNVLKMLRQQLSKRCPYLGFGALE